MNHFLFSCPDYAILRATLSVSVINISQKNNLNYLGNQSKLYLYGHPSITSTENTKILLSTFLNLSFYYFFNNPLPLPSLFIHWFYTFLVIYLFSFTLCVLQARIQRGIFGDLSPTLNFLEVKIIKNV